MSLSRSIASILCVVFASTASPAVAQASAGQGGADEVLVPLFDGKSLDAFEQHGGKAKYSVEDGMIVGTTVPNTPNSFLCTKKHYGDFILEYEFKIDSKLNSGVQIRSQVNEKNDRVFGYQCEIDVDESRARWWTAGLYDESRRGWLDPAQGDKAHEKAFTKQGARLDRPGDWYHVRIVAFGDRIRTWLNGEPRADLIDAETLTGLIGLQVHGVGGREDPLTVRWRNLRIRELGSHEWRKLFNGKNLDGFRALPGGSWKVEEGAIHGTSPASDARHGILLTEARFSDFTLRGKFRVVSGDSGLYFRVEPVEGNVSVHGFQVEVDSSLETGGLYETGGRGWVIQPDAEQMQGKYKPGEWTDLLLRAQGGEVRVWINGVLTAWLQNDPGRTEGHLGLQLHGGQDMDVWFRDLEVLTALQ